MEKTLGNTTVLQAKANVKDLVVWGDGDMFKLLCKASSQSEGWMKSTKAMEIPGAGCVVQVTTQQRNPDGSYVLAEAVCFVPGVFIKVSRSCVTAVSDNPEDGNHSVILGRILQFSSPYVPSIEAPPGISK